MLAIYKKEVRSYLYSMIGCVMIAVTLAAIGFFTTLINLRSGHPGFDYTLGFMIIYCIFLIIVPFITMRSIADERHTKTEQLLFSLPVPMSKIVIAKYFAQLTVFAIPMVIAAFYPIILSFYGDGAVNFASVYSAWTVLFLLLAAMIAIGMFISSLVENQIIAAIATVGLFLVLYFMSNITYALPKDSSTSLIGFCGVAVIFGAIVWAWTKNYVAGGIGAALPTLGLLVWYIFKPESFVGLFPEFIGKLSIFDRFLEVVSYQNLDLTAVIYYISIAFVFVFVTVQSVEKRRWN